MLLENLFVLGSVHCAGERRNRTLSLPCRGFYFVGGDNCGGGYSVGFEEYKKVASLVSVNFQLNWEYGRWCGGGWERETLWLVLSLHRGS